MDLKAAKARKVAELDGVERERRDIEAREVEIQRLLKETGEKYERLRVEAGIGEEGGANETAERGLESLGGTPRALQNVGDS